MAMVAFVVANDALTSLKSSKVCVSAVLADRYPPRTTTEGCRIHNDAGCINSTKPVDVDAALLKSYRAPYWR